MGSLLLDSHTSGTFRHSRNTPLTGGIGIPDFEKIRLDKIISKDINNWLPGFKERKVISADGKEETRSYKNTYANTVFGTFWLMLNEAVNRGIITVNPAAAVKKLKNGRKAIDSITAVEVRLLFPR